MVTVSPSYAERRSSCPSALPPLLRAGFGQSSSGDIPEAHRLRDGGRGYGAGVHANRLCGRGNTEHRPGRISGDYRWTGTLSASAERECRTARGQRQRLPSMIRVVTDLQADIAAVTGVRPAVSVDQVTANDEIVLTGTIGKSPLIDQPVSAGMLDASGTVGDLARAGGGQPQRHRSRRHHPPHPRHAPHPPALSAHPAIRTRQRSLTGLTKNMGTPPKCPPRRLLARADADHRPRRASAVTRVPHLAGPLTCSFCGNSL